MSIKTTARRNYRLTAAELAAWNQNGYIVRHNVFTATENDTLRQTAEEIVDGKRPYPEEHIDRNALVREGKIDKAGIYAMHKLHHPSCFDVNFLARTRDPRLTDPLVDILGPDLIGKANLFIWKAPEIGLGFPWHQDMFYFQKRFKTATTVGTWTAIDAADQDNGCLYVIPGSHKGEIRQHDDLEGPQQMEFRLARDVNNAAGVPVEVPAGAVVWFHSYLLHKSTDNHSQRFRRSYVAHYLSAQAEWQDPDNPILGGAPLMLIRGQTYPDKVHQVETDIVSW